MSDFKLWATRSTPGFWKTTCPGGVQPHRVSATDWWVVSSCLSETKMSRNRQGISRHSPVKSHCDSRQVKTISFSLRSFQTPNDQLWSTSLVSCPCQLLDSMRMHALHIKSNLSSRRLRLDWWCSQLRKVYKSPSVFLRLVEKRLIDGMAYRNYMELYQLSEYW